MNNRLLRFYNQNRYLVWIIIITIIAVIVLLQILNNFVAEKNLQEYTDNNYEDIKSKNDENYIVLTGRKTNKETSNIINSFIDLCNDGSIQEAYELLSDDCKSVLYPDLQGFKQNYYDKMFNTKKLYSYQAITKNNNYYTYQVRFSEDILATRENNRCKYCGLLYSN